MFDGVRRRGARDAEESSGIPSRFISDVLTLDQITVSILDTGSMLLVEFISAAVAIALLEPVALAVIFPTLVAIWVVTRRTQEPAATAGLRRQEELERMTRSIVRELPDPDEEQAKSRFRTAVERVMHAEIRYGWLQAINRQGSAGLAKLGPIAVVVVAAFAGTAHVGTLISLYLLAQRGLLGLRRRRRPQPRHPERPRRRQPLLRVHRQPRPRTPSPRRRMTPPEGTRP